MKRIYLIGALCLALPSVAIGYHHQPTPTTPTIQENYTTPPPATEIVMAAVEPVEVTPTPTPSPLSNTSSGFMSAEAIQAIIIKWAEHYGVDSAWLLRIAECESSMNPANINLHYSDGGNPSGLFQYVPPTWASFSAKAGLPGANIWDVEAQAQVTAWAFANGLSGHWECK